MPKISAIIITFNEEKFIGKCLESLGDIADEIVVVDSFSTDSTGEICRKHNVRFIQHPFEGYVEQKNYALTHAMYPLVLSLDADEALSAELKDSIMKIKENPQYDGYYFNRLNNYYGRWIRHSRWYPDRHLRLFNPLKGRWTGPNPHDRFVLNPGCRSGWLKGDILHWIYSSIEEHADKINRFSTIAANEYFKAGKKVNFFTGPLHMIWSFIRSYILRAGFLDGHVGHVHCFITAYGSYLKYSKLRRLIVLAGKKEKQAQ
jgi:glycosyltransferase involved in cell wall biosynthesis